VIGGKMQIELRAAAIHLEAGEMCVTPQGVEHKPAADPHARFS
jgi:mannose-6-phosphate isomerase-like protein (cupin superfamily)